jgi:hypothetical protein
LPRSRSLGAAVCGDRSRSDHPVNRVALAGFQGIVPAITLARVNRVGSWSDC